MPKRTRSYRETLLEALHDQTEAAEYLNAALEDSEEMALVALRDIAEARQMARVADEAGVAREALYRMLRKTGNPTYSSLMAILNALGLRVIFAPAAPVDDRTRERVYHPGAVSGELDVTGAKNENSISQGTLLGDTVGGTLGFQRRKPPTIAQEISANAGCRADLSFTSGSCLASRPI